MTRGRGVRAPIAPPPVLLRLAEARLPLEALAILLLGRWLRSAPRGDGHPVLLIPGLLFGDRWMGQLHAYLRSLGYEVAGWAQGRNLGPRAGVQEALLGHFDRLYAHTGRKVSIVGWSLGGAWGRLLALQRPAQVRQLVTLGTPITSVLQASRAAWIYARVSGQSEAETRQWERVIATPPALPMTAIHSRSDAVVAWRATLLGVGPQAENVRVISSHLGLPHNPSVLYVVADRLAQPEGAWHPFRAPARFGWAYPGSGGSS